MTEPSAAVLFQRFSRQARQLEILTDQAIKQRRKSNLSILSTDALFTSALLSLHLRFELFLEDLFYSCITGSSGILDCAPEITFSSRQQAESIFFGNRQYATWMPFERGALTVARRAFGDGAPFTRLRRQPDEKKFLEEFTAIRNAIAHQSASSLKKIEHLTSPMRARRRTPAGYLQNTIQGETQFSVHTSSIRVIAAALAQADLAAAKSKLSPEAPYGKKDEVVGGKYQCETCGYYKTLRTRKGVLGGCARCKRLNNHRQKSWRRVY